MSRRLENLFYSVSAQTLIDISIAITGTQLLVSKFLNMCQVYVILILSSIIKLIGNMLAASIGLGYGIMPGFLYTFSHAVV